MRRILVALLCALLPAAAGAAGLDYPSYADREGWKEFFGDRAELYIAEGEKYLDYRYEYVPASVYLAFETGGDRSSFGADYRARAALVSCIMAELAEGKGRFQRTIVDGVWYFAEKISWVHPQHAKRKSTGRSLGDPDEEIIGITSSFIGMDVAYAWHFFHEEWDRIDPSIGRAALKALDTHIFNPFLDERLTDSNWWLGFTPGVPIINWCPWINFNCMLAAFLVQPPVTDAMKERSLRSMRAYMDYLKPDGSCDEGPSYWGEAAGKVFDYVYLWRMATGEDCGIVSPERLRAMGEYVVDLYVGDGWSVNYADGFGRMSSSDVCSSFLYRFGEYAGSRRLKDYSMLSYSEAPSGDIFNRLEFCRVYDSYRSYHASLPEGFSERFARTLGDAWYPSGEVAVMRRGSWTFSAIGHDNYAGPRNDTHNHDDVGSFVLYLDGMPVAVDMGKSTPTNGTYDKERYTFFHICSASHNVPDINGVLQGEGSDRKASDVACDIARGRLSMDIAPAYPPEARVRSWRRSFSLDSGGLTVKDDYSLSGRTAADTLHIMVRGDVHELRPGLLGITVRDFDGGRTAEVTLSYNPALDLRAEPLEMTDPAFRRIWGPSLCRLCFVTSPSAPVSGRWTFRFR